MGKRNPAYSAKRDCWSPVPLITTSHSVSERDSILQCYSGKREKEEEQKAENETR